MDIQSIITTLSQQRPIFHNEADFQHALAWAVREHYPEAKIRLEVKVKGPSTKMYLDILASIAGRKYAIELKYKTRPVEYQIDGEEFSLSNQGAQDTGRYDVLKDIYRLEQMVASEVVDEGVLVFLTNDWSYYSNPGEEKQTADRDFRLHEGRKIHGALSWSEQTGQGTMRGREEVLTIHGHYECHWRMYSHLSTTTSGEFRYLLIPVRKGQIEEDTPQSTDVSVNKEIKYKETISVHNDMPNVEDGDSSTHWFDSFIKRRDISVSQVDLRERLTRHLRELGYSISTNRHLGQEKIDIWAEKGSDVIAIEVRNKTALLQTVYADQSVNLKNQAAQDVSRYDFINDIGKLERVVKAYPGAKGYALLVTNDSSYWQPTQRQASFDESFRIHDGKTLKGLCAWKEEASPGTTAGREASIELEGVYELHWIPYVNLGSGKNQQFQALLVDVG